MPFSDTMQTFRTETEVRPADRIIIEISLHLNMLKVSFDYYFLRNKKKKRSTEEDLRVTPPLGYQQRLMITGNLLQTSACTSTIVVIGAHAHNVIMSALTTPLLPSYQRWYEHWYCLAQDIYLMVS